MVTSSKDLDSKDTTKVTNKHNKDNKSKTTSNACTWLQQFKKSYSRERWRDRADTYAGEKIEVPEWK